MRCALTRQLVSTFARTVAGPQPRWIGCEPAPRQRLYFANHSSHLDSIVIWTCLPPEIRSKTRPIGAKDYWAAGSVRPWIVKSFNALLIDRKRDGSGEDPIETIIHALEDGSSLIFFPEGTRNPTGEIGEFKSGIFHIASRRPDVELVPVYMENLNRVLPKGDFLPVPLMSSVSFGAPIRYEPGETKEQFLARARDALLRLKS